MRASLALLTAACFFAAPQSSASTYSELFSFDLTDGEAPGFLGDSAPLTMGADRTLYGATYIGGALAHCASGAPGTPSGCGVVFELSPPAAPGMPWKETVLHSFVGGADGLWPVGGLILDGDGALYGATKSGGNPLSGPPICNNGSDSNDETGCGAVFKLTPPATGGGEWKETVLHVFPNGVWGASGVVLGSDGALYGTTYAGGASVDGLGVVYRLSPPARHGEPWTLATLHSFASGSGVDGVHPASGVVFAADGALCGTTTESSYDPNCKNARAGNGVVHRLSPPKAEGGPWTDSILQNFACSLATEGGFANSGLIVSETGELYGATVAGGSNGYGAVFELR